MRFSTITVDIILGYLALAAALPTGAGSADDSCCCCDISRSAIVCKTGLAASECMCTLASCPADAPTIWESATDTSSVTPATPIESRDEQAETIECCCCDISINAISCQIKVAEAGCYCQAVVCPADAPTVWPFGNEPQGVTSA